MSGLVIVLGLLLALLFAVLISAGIGILNAVIVIDDEDAEEVRRMIDEAQG